MTQLLRDARPRGPYRAPPIMSRAREGDPRLSFPQERLWFLDRLQPGNTAFNLNSALRLSGETDERALERALGEIVRRHEALRTVFREVDGVPVQSVVPFAGLDLPVEDLSGLDEAAREAEVRRRAAEGYARVYDLAAGPLFRASLLRLGAEERVLLLGAHPMVCDSWSHHLLLDELRILYHAYREGRESPLPELAIQYADYAAWQRAEGRAAEGTHLAYWKRRLAGAPELLALPTDRPRSPVPAFRGARVPLAVSADVLERLRRVALGEGATLHMVVLAVFQALLSKHAGSEDVAVGSPVAGRMRPELEELIGCFENTVVLRTDLSGDPTLRELVGRVRETALGARQHQEVPFERVLAELRPERSLGHAALFQVMFLLDDAASSAAGGEAGAWRWVAAGEPESTPFDLTLSLVARPDGLSGALEYSTDLYDRGTAARMAAHLVRLLEQAAADADARLSAVSLLGEAERRQVVETWNQTAAPYPADRCIHELFEAQAARTPDSVAVVFGNEALSYAALNARANRLARYLRATGVGAGARVAVCVERSHALVVAVLAALKSGAAFVPLDPAYPADRLRFMLEDSGPAALLTRGARAGLFPDLLGRVVDVDGDEWRGMSDENLDRGGATPAGMAFITYTSGSTGRPKGVCHAHHRVLNLIHWYGREFALSPGDRLLIATSFSFDGTYRNVFAPLFAGAELHLAGERFDPEVIVAQIAASRIGMMNLTPTAFGALIDAAQQGELSAMRVVILGGEAVQPRKLLELPEPRPALVNVYGPTECSGITTFHRLSAGLEPYLDRPVPVGRPLANARVYILDARGEPVPVGMVGEIHIGGVPVGPGYHERPALTAERYVADPFSAEPGARMYRTGDLGRFLADGTIEVRGRNDAQVKVRGFRVEPGEIEARLAAHPAVRDVAVATYDDAPGDTRLVAYYVAAEGGVTVEALRAHAAGQLPEYMVPSAYVRMDALPVSPNGKLDRRALPKPARDAVARRDWEAPVGEMEEALAEIWREVLGVEQVGREDHFFELGGHSLLAVRAISRIRQALGAEVELATVFERPVLKELAEALAAAGRAELPAIERAERSEPLPLSFAQQRLWFIEKLGKLGSTYHVTERVRLRGMLDREALVRALDRLVARHEALRTTFRVQGGEPEQWISPESSRFALVEHDLAGHEDAPGELGRVMAEEGAALFDLERGPLIRGRLVRLVADDHVLLLTMHHIVSDEWSMGVLVDELSALYAAFRAGRSDPLPPLPVQYADYAAWQRRWVQGQVLEAQAGYWTDTLAGAPEVLELPADRPRPPRQDHAGAYVGVELEEALAAELRELSRRNGTTLFMTLLAGWAIVLSRLSGQEEVVVGTPTANRGRAEIEGLIGFFVNTLALRVDLSGSPSVAEVLARVKARALEAQQNQDIPFEQVVERVAPARSLAHTPLFQVMFAWQNAPPAEPRLPGLELGEVPGAQRSTAKFDLALSLRRSGGRIVGEVEYATALYDGATVERYLGYLRRVLEQMADEGRRVERLALMGEAERRRVVEEWNRTAAPYPDESCVHELFEAQVERTPDAVAVVHAAEALSYAALDARANRLARALVGRGVTPGARVAILLPRSVDLVVAELAVLKAGAAYVPFDPSNPPERIAFVLADSAARLVLTRAGEALPHLPGVERIDVETVCGGDAHDVRLRVGGEALAYVMYTSGSTGEPKGVMVPHRAIAQLVLSNGYADLGADDRVALAANPAFDAATMEVWGPLLNGGRIVVAGQEVLLDPDAYGALLRNEGVTALLITPVLFNHYAQVIPEALARLRYVLTGGDRAEPAAYARVLAEHGRVRVYNCYGPTETTCFSVAHAVAAEDVAEGARGVPIGRPKGNTRAYVLDAQGQPVPIGVVGELHVGGAGVAHGYLGRPKLTAERFVADAFGVEPGGRLYRTGDRVRRLADGRLEFVGRNDFQVKVRGFRIEPGEIEARLLEHPAVREAVVVAREDAPGAKRLVAYWGGADEVGVDRLRAHLLERLPEHMVPAAYVRLEALPLTPNGKVDRSALPAPEDDAYARRGYEAPTGDTERALAEIWREVLGVERVGRWDHFFERGGHSLLVVQAVSRVRQVLGVELEFDAVFERPVLKELAEALAAAGRADLPVIERVDRSGRLPVSFAQQRLWFLERMGELGSTYHVPHRLRLRGELDPAALVRALDRLVARHEVLRTTFAVVNGEPEQRVAPETSRFRLVEHDLAGEAREALERVMDEEATAPFDLERGPLIRGRLIRLDADDHVLLLTMHHIVADGWSMGVLVDELGRLYGAFREGRADPLPPLPIQYADYAAWQRRWVEDRVLEAQASYWTKTLAGAPELIELPTDHPRPPRQDHAGASAALVLDEALTAGLKELGRRRGTTLFMTLLAGWATVLARLSGQPEVVVGTATANRGRREIEGLIGFFVNTLALRVGLSERSTVAQLLEQVKRRALEAQQNQDIPFEQVVERMQPTRSRAHSPLFQVSFAWQNAPRGELKLPGLELGDVPGAEHTVAKFDLSLALSEADGRIVGGLDYATSLYEAATVERYLGYLRRVLEQMAADDGRAVERLALLPAAERRLVVEEWNRTEAEVPRDACVHALFEGQVARTPDAVAVVFGEEALSYAELNRRANRLAHHLRERGVRPDARVAICVERGLEMIVALLGVLKAGGAYVPLDPGYPAERLRYMLGDSGARVVLTQRSIATAEERLFAGFDVEVLALDAPEWEEQAATNPARGELSPDHLAYVIYTSGSTGMPKGVLIAHGGVVNLAHAGFPGFGVEPDSHVLQFSSFSFDACVFEVFRTLTRGASLYLAPRGKVLAGETLGQVVARYGITHVVLPPAVLEAMPEGESLDSIRTLVVAGDAVREPVVRRWAPGRRLVNAYGPSETTVCASLHSCRSDEPGDPSIGRPIANTRIYLLDGGGDPVPVGVVGELYIGGAGLARGYHGRPALTAERFVANPFSTAPGARLYRTGDLGRWRPDGTIEFLGRNDFQAKIRGFRIELGEIEGRLKEHAAVREAVVVARREGPGDRRLVAYWVGEAGVEAEALHAHLRARLPEHMVPAAYVRLEALPLSPSGKIERKALPSPEDDAYARRGYEAPVGEVEQALAEIWSEVLGVERVGRRDDFFELGGHSLLVVRMISRIRQVLEVEVKPGTLFDRPVLGELAEAVAAAGRAELPAIERADRSARLPLSYAQQRLWFLERMGDLGSTYHIPQRLRLRGELDREALARALDRLAARHEVLRTTFAMVNGEPEQRIAPETGRFRLVEHDLAGESREALERVMDEEAAAPFDLERGPLIRGRLVRLAEDDHVLLLTMHHIVSDGWSMGVLVDELGRLYAAFREGRADPLPALPIQYADYAAWQRRWVEDEVLEAQAGYWKRTLSGAPELLELPADRPRPRRQDHVGAYVNLELDESLTAELKGLSRRHGTTLFMTLLAGWATVLGRLARQEEVVVGTTTANRGRAEIEGLIGFFVNTLALRIDLSERPTVAGVLGRVKRRALEAQQNQDIPFEQVVELAQPTRSLAHTPLFQVAFDWQNARQGELTLPGLELEAVPGGERGAAKVDLALSLREVGGRIVGSATYATSLFERATAERYVGYLVRALGEMAADEGRRIEALRLLPDTERAQVVEAWNATAVPYPATCVHDLIEAQAARTPNAVAIVFDDQRLTYAELDGRANTLARKLRSLGVGPGAYVPVLMERCAEVPVAFLGVLKAGAAFVPLHPRWPVERLRSAVGELDAAVVLTAAGAAEWPPLGRPLLPVGGSDADTAGPLGVRVDTRAPMYAIYTSGSTGRPKAAVVAHRGVANRFQWMTETFGAQSAEAMLQTVMHVYDGAVLLLLWPLTIGGRVVMPRPDTESDALYLGGLIDDEGVTMTGLAPSIFNTLVPQLTGGERRLTSLRCLLLGGEQIDREATYAFMRHLPRVRINNMYGPTEATIGSIWHELTGAEQGRIPIGRPIANTRAYVLGAGLEPAPVGVPGEIYLGGVCVGLGYLKDGAKTAAAFVPDPFGEPGARLYRTGDLGRWRETTSAEVRECGSALDPGADAGTVASHDSERTSALPHSRTAVLEYLGRNDFQVKVRGFRIELGEIEARLRDHEGVREAVVLAREAAGGDRRLVAYYVGAGGAIEVEALRAHLLERLPEYMVPAAYVHLEALPLTPNGKVDRRALPAPEDDAYARRGYEAPVGETEQALAEIWSEVLGVERVGRLDHFFEVGGHSLLVVRVISRVRQVLGAEVEIGLVFERPVLKELAEAIAAAGRADLPPIERADREAPLPLSYAQQRLWFLEQLGNLGSTYHIPGRLRLRGELDREALVRALDRLTARHEVLRTTFSVRGGEPEQRIAPETSRFHLVEHDLAGEAMDVLERVMDEEAIAPFDLERGPLIRGRLIRLAADDHVLLLTMHHIVSDGWSMSVFMGELSALYGAFRAGRADPLPPLPIQYADYAAWQRRWVEDRVLEAQAGYWTKTLAGAPELIGLPTDHPRPQRQDHAGAALRVELDESLTARLKALGRRRGTTPFMTLLAGWATVLARLSGQSDVVVGTATANRGRREIEGLIGYFINTLAVYVDLSARPTVAELLEQVKRRALEAQQNQDIPFEQVVELAQPTRSRAHSPLFQVSFVWQNAPQGELKLPGLELGDVPGAEYTRAKLDLSLTLAEADGRIVGGVIYATALFERATVERYLAYLVRVLEQMAADDGQAVDRLALLPAAERRRVVEEWNATSAEVPRDACVHALFEAQVARTPDAVAVVCGEEALSYAGLNRRANRLAHHLRMLGVGPDARVAICVERSPEMVVGVLGVLKAGGAYVPLDPGYPVERLRYMLSDSAPAVVLTQSSIAAAEDGPLAGVDVAVLALDAPAWREESAANPERGELGPAHLAYVIYTSGSTGTPKGVMVAHRNVANLVAAQTRAVAVDDTSRVLQFASFSFDACVFEMVMALCRGASLHVPPGADLLAGEALERVVARGRITHVTLPPAVLPTLTEGADLSSVQAMLLAGEAVPAAAVKRWAGGRRLLNAYGPTEATVWTTFHECRADESGNPPIGSPIANARVYVLDAAGEPVPAGVAGELYIGGAGVARGYLGRPELTAERFVADPFGGEPGARLYRTGDLGRWRADGAIEFLGRNDFQVKIRGFRVELGEIEARLGEHPAVREAVVVARGEGAGDQRLVAYWVGEEAAAGAEALRAHLGERLPEHMVPAAYVRLEALPLTPSGKLERKALPSPEGEAYARRGYEAPVGEVEEALAEIWSEVLEVEGVSRWDDFFELGGHSVLVILVVSRIRQLLDVEVDPGQLFERPVLAALAEWVLQLQLAQFDPDELARLADSLGAPA